MYKYRVEVTRVVDGDTVDVDIDLGFGMTYKKQRVRMMGIDTPESRTRDLEEKKAGLFAKKVVLHYLPEGSKQVLRTHKDKVGKYGRVLGEFVMYDGDQDRQTTINEFMIRHRIGVEYGGKSKDEIKQQQLDNRKYLEDNNPRQIYNSTFKSDKVYHAMYLEDEDSLNFLYRMEKEPEGYSRNDHLLDIPLEDAIHLPSGKRFGNKNIELLSLSQAIGSIEFPQDLDGLTRRAPTAVFFEGPEHVYPSLVMANIMDILGIPSNGFDYDFEKNILTLADSSGTVIREIPIDNEGRMFVNFYGVNKTFNYLPYMYCVDPNLLPPDYWKDKVAFVGTSLPGLYDLRNTPVQETFPGVEIHANVMYSILQNEFVSILSTQSKIIIIIL